MKRKAGASTLSSSMLPDKRLDNARKIARHRINSSLEKSSDPVACPDCGKLQPNMIRNTKQRRIFYLLGTIPTAMVIFYSFAEMEHKEQVRNIGMIALAAALAGGIIWVLLYNFNAYPDRRKKNTRAVRLAVHRQRVADEEKEKLAAKSRISGYA
jgi:hypothetical protein